MGEWSRIWINNQVGYVYTKYMGRQTWYTGKGPRVMFANTVSTPIYREDLLDTGTMPVLTYLNIGYLIADQLKTCTSRSPMCSSRTVKSAVFI